MNKTFRKALGLLLCTGMVMSAAACGSTSNHSTESKQTEQKVSSEADTQQSEGAVKDFGDEEPYEVIIENMTLGQNMDDLASVEEAVNAITLPNINCTVKINNIHIADHATKISLMAAGGEKIDLITTGRTVPLSQMVSDGTLIPLDDLLEEKGKTLLEKNGDLLDGCRINGSVYAVSANLYPGSDLGFEYNADMAKRLEIEIPDNPTWDYLEEVAQTLKENDVYLLTQGNGEASSQLFSIMNPAFASMGGSNYMYGAVRDLENSTEIVNVFKTQEYKDYCKRLRKWYENGWIPADSLVNGQNGSDVFKSEQTFMQWTGVCPTEMVLQAKSFPFEIVMFSMAEGYISTSSVQEVGWGISTTSERPEKAMEFLNFMYENADVANLLMNGIEGKEYKKVSDNVITYADGADASNLGYSRNFSVFGDTMQTFQWEPATEEYYDEVKTFNESCKISPLLGYTFDTANVSTEIAAVSNVIAEYMPSLECGVIEDVDQAIDEFNAALDSAGIEKIIEENQRQLDEWLAANK